MNLQLSIHSGLHSLVYHGARVYEVLGRSPVSIWFTSLAVTEYGLPVAVSVNWPEAHLLPHHCYILWNTLACRLSSELQSSLQHPSGFMHWPYTYTSQVCSSTIGSIVQGREQWMLPQLCMMAAVVPHCRSKLYSSKWRTGNFKLLHAISSALAGKQLIPLLM